MENDFCVEEEVLPKNDLERNREDDDKDDDEEETEEEEEHVVVGFIIIIAFTRRQTKCSMCTCFRAKILT